MESLLKDVRYGLRTLLRNPTFTIVATLTIGLGIGANTAIFSVVRAVLLRPLPYEDPEELVMVWTDLTARNVEDFLIAPNSLRDIREGSRLLEDLAGVSAFQQPLLVEGEPIQIHVGGVTPNFFRVLGVEPVLGRNFVEADADPGDAAPAQGAFGNPPRVAMLSHAFWRTYYGSDPSVIGRTLTLGGASVEIVGVLPSDFQSLLPPAANVPPEVGIWNVPTFDLTDWNPANVVFAGVGRLRDGSTVDQLRSELGTFTRALRERVPVFATAGGEFVAEPLHRDLTADVRPVVLALLVAVAFVLLIACANVSNLLLVRAAGREREMAVRAAMGGSRMRLLRQLLIESVVLASLGAVFGLVLAQAGVEVLLALQPDNLPRLDTVKLDAAVLGFAAMASLGAAVVFGLIPAVQGSRLQLSESLRDRGRAAGAARNAWLRNAVVVAEVAASVVLLIGAGLMLRSFAALQAVDPGYVTEDVLTFQAPLDFGRYPTPEERSVVVGLIEERLAALPGVRAVSAVFPPLLGGPPLNGRYGTEDALQDESLFGQAAYKVVRPGFFEAMGAELVAGRFPTRADDADSAAVVVVDDKLAELTWPGESAIGKQVFIRFFTDEPVPVEVIGVVRRLRHTTLSADARETIYFNDRYAGSFGAGTWMVRANNPLGLVESVRREVNAVDPTVPLAEVRALEEDVARDMGPTRFSLTLIGVFGLTALILASVGLYGVLSNVVRQRTAEIGVRMAFGAAAASILTMVVRQGLVLAGIGLLIGLVAAYGVTGLMESLLVGVAPADPLTFGATALVFLAVAGVSCYVPARRATLVDPISALREE